MNDQQIAILVRNKLLVSVTNDYPELAAINSRFTRGMAHLDEINKETDGAGSQQEINITGVTTDKNDKMGELTHYTMEVSGILQAYAASINDPILLSKVLYKASMIDKMTQTQLIYVATVLIEEASKIAPEVLAEEGVSVAEMIEFKALHTEFNTVSSAPRKAIIVRKGSTKSLAELFAEARDLKKNTLDPLSVVFKRKAPLYYDAYKSASIIISRQGTPTPEDPEVTPTV